MVLPALKESDPGRYGALHHPGDAFSFDIFSQAARAIRDGGVLGPLPVECLLATGQSQSAIHLVTFVNAVVPTVPPEAACDGYLIGSRTGFAAPLTGWDGRIRTEGPDGARVRTDGRAPVLTVQTESDVTGVLAGVTAQDHEAAEVAGAAAEIAAGSGVAYTFERRPGTPADAILSGASSQAAAGDGEPVIVVGRSGHAARHVLGSVPVRLLHHSSYPVLAIP
jgi:nucleotide-binding universal stress UspA family protein